MTSVQLNSCPLNPYKMSYSDIKWCYDIWKCTEWLSCFYKGYRIPIYKKHGIHYWFSRQQNHNKTSDIITSDFEKKKKKDCCIMILYVLIRKPVTSSKFISLAVQSNPRHLLNNSVQTVSFKWHHFLANTFVRFGYKKTHWAGCRVFLTEKCEKTEMYR